MRILLLPLAAALAACGPAEEDPGPDAATLDEERAIAEAEEMVEQRRTSAPASADDTAAESEKPSTEEATNE